MSRSPFLDSDRLPQKADPLPADQPIPFYLTQSEREFCAWAMEKLREKRNGGRHESH